MPLCNAVEQAEQVTSWQAGNLANPPVSALAAWILIRMADVAAGQQLAAGRHLTHLKYAAR
jgi:hypothetical protein